MKKTLLMATVIISVVLNLLGCASTSKTSKEVSKEVRSSNVENNVSVQARKTVIVDWQDRSAGAKVNPEWLLGITRGNGDLYIRMYGISDEYANHKWFVRSAQNRVKDVAQTIAETEVLFGIGQEMANTINATIGTALNNNQKDVIRNVCSKVNNVSISGVGNRGSYWQLEITTDEYGNTANMYNYYAIYSCTYDTYNKLLNMYMINLLKSNELDEESVSAIKKNAQEILNDAKEKSEHVEKAKEREWKTQLIHEQNQLQLEREKTLRSQAESFANAAANQKEFTSLSMQSAGNATMDPALASLIASTL